jgi:hypothetical protein
MGTEQTSVHICGTTPNRRISSSIVWRVLVVVGLGALGILIWKGDGGARWKGEWLNESARNGGFTANDRVVHFERPPARDPYCFHELQLSASTFENVYRAKHQQATEDRDRLLAKYGAGSPYFGASFDNPPKSGPAWWTIPADAEIVKLEFQTYAFVRRTKTVFIYRWTT